jgi:hypothetical protein
MIEPSPVRLTTRPLCTAIVGSMRFAAERPEAGKCTVFVCAGQTAESDDVGGKDRSEFARFGHRAPFTGPN